MEAMKMMSALAQPTRLAVFRTLVERLPEGMASGDIAQATGTSANTMSAHLAILHRAGAVSSERMGRTIVYKAEPSSVRALARFLKEQTR